MREENILEDNVVISEATPDEIPTIVDFVKSARAAMFPMLSAESHDQLATRELAGAFQQAYLDDPDGAFLTAKVDGVVVATIGYVAYDSRFPQLQLGPGRTVEVVRLFVDPGYRRIGLASRLFVAIKGKAQRAGIEQLYLHTHPFLPGARNFWERNGFVMLQVDDDEVWQTIHMSFLLKK